MFSMHSEQMQLIDNQNHRRLFSSLIIIEFVDVMLQLYIGGNAY